MAEIKTKTAEGGQLKKPNTSPERSRRTYNILSTFFFYFSILIFIIGFNFSDTSLSGGWTQQFMPSSLPNFQLSDIYFLDSLTGWAVTGNSSPNDSSGYILKTINRGDNWTLKFGEYRDFSRVKFINSQTGFVSGGYFNGARLYKTTNGGDNWSNIYNLAQIYLSDMSVLDENTIWVTNPNSLEGGVYYTSNGGASWTHQLNAGAGNPDRIYMYNARIGFAAKSSGSSLYRTTDGGDNWTLIDNNEGFNDMYFVDSLTGWKAGPMKKTTNGGLNWVTQTMPGGGYISTSGISRFTNVNRDTIWGCGGTLFYPGQGTRAFLHRTNNGGDNWLLQIPDTGYQIVNLSFVDFVDRLIGWSYRVGPTGIHTATGGNDTFFTFIKQISTAIPSNFKLFQNYPNPFNPRTVIRYEVRSQRSEVRMIVYDITGREITTLVNKVQNTGTYEVDFSGNGLSSGVYFYRIIITNEKGGEVHRETKKMLMIK